MPKSASMILDELADLASRTHEEFITGDPLWLRYSLWRFGLPGVTKISRLLAPVMEAGATIRLIDQVRDSDRYSLIVATDGIYQTKRSRLSDGWVRRVGIDEMASIEMEQSSFQRSQFLDLVATGHGGNAFSYRVGQFTPSGFEATDDRSAEELVAVRSRILSAVQHVRR